MPTRRTFLSTAVAISAAGYAAPRLADNLASGQDRSAPGEDFVRGSQPLPAPIVRLPTDDLPPPRGEKKKIAAITTTYFKYSHADDIITKFIEGYGVVGRIHQPHCEVVSLFVDQFPETDIARGMAARYSIPLMPTPTSALTLDHETLQVDGVLLIGEHGDYPTNAKGQKMYPRRQLFEEIVRAFRASGRGVPVFNDKHLSFSWENAAWMYQQARELRFPMMAGSSVPVTWRIPPLSFQDGVPLKEALVVGYGGFESYGFHCLEFLQSFVERRPGGETGVQAVQVLEGAAAETAARRREWPANLMPAAIGTVPPLHANAAAPDPQDLRGAIIFRIFHSDGFESTVCLAENLVSEFCFAATVDGRSEPVATRAVLPKPQRDHFSFLCNHVEVMFRTGKPSYPVERTLLVTGVLDALHDSRLAGGKRVETPHLRELRYTPAREFAAA